MDLFNDMRNVSWTAKLDFEDRPSRMYHASYVLIVVTAWMVYRLTRPSKTNAPLGNPPTSILERLFKLAQRVNFFRNGNKLMRDAWRRYPEQCFQMTTDLGDIVVLPNEFANLVRSDERFNYVAFYDEVT